MGLFNDSSASDAAKNARAIVSGVNIPSIDQARAELLKYVQQGILTPAQAATFLQEQTEYNKIQEDPRLRGSQIDALNQYQDIANAGGLDAQARAQLAQVQSQQAEQNRGEQQAILDNARARGQGGSDLEFVNRLLAQQNAATRGATQAPAIAAEAEQRRNAALDAMAGLAGNIRNADYSKQANEAAAADAINRFNAAARTQANQVNVQNANQAQQLNLQQKQNVADKNVAQANQVPEQIRQMQMQKANSQAAQENALGQAKASEHNSNTSLIGNALGAVGGLLLSDERAKKDIKPFDASALLDDITGVKFRYRDPANGHGQMAGVLAQDVEKHAPGAVHERADGMKQIDNGQLGGLLLAALGDVHKRVRALEGHHNV